MDLAKKDQSTFNKRIPGIIIYLPVFWLIFHLFTMFESGVQEKVVIEEYSYYRSIYYSVYIFLSIIVGLYILIKRPQLIDMKAMEERRTAGTISTQQNTLVGDLIVRLLIAIILTTFSFSISKLLADIFLGLI